MGDCCSIDHLTAGINTVIQTRGLMLHNMHPRQRELSLQPCTTAPEVFTATAAACLLLLLLQGVW
jgi:hypothetical protein